MFYFMAVHVASIEPVSKEVAPILVLTKCRDYSMLSASCACRMARSGAKQAYSDRRAIALIWDPGVKIWISLR